MNLGDIKFTKTNDNYWYGSVEIGHLYISLTAGKFNYSIPFETLKSPNDYESYEVIVSDKLLNNAIVTHDYFPYPKNNIAPYVSKEEINKILNKLFNEYTSSNTSNLI